ncbi:MAG: ATP-binding protein [bacterium]|nr:ATP-binding protein [bacterium]
MRKRNAEIKEPRQAEAEKAGREEVRQAEAGKTGSEEVRQAETERAGWKEELRQVEAEKIGWEKEVRQAEAEKIGWEKEVRQAEIERADRKEEERQAEQMKESDRMRGQKKKFHLTGSTAVKVTAFILLFVSIIVGVASGVGCYLLASEGAYFGRESELMMDCVWGPARRVAFEVRDRLNAGHEDTIASWISNMNAEVAILEREDDVVQDSSVFLWKSYSEADAKGENGFYSLCYLDFQIWCSYSFEEQETGKSSDEKKEQAELSGAGEQQETPEQIYLFRVFLDPEMEADDEIRIYYNLAAWFYELRFVMIGLLIGSVLLAVVCFVFLLCSAGHKNGKAGITPGPVTRLPFDVVTAAAVFLLAGMICLFQETTYYYDEIEQVISGGAFLLALGVLFMLWLMDFAVRLKLGSCWRNTLTFIVLRAVWRGLRFSLRGIGRLLRELPTVLTVMIAYLGLSILEMLGLAVCGGEAEAFLLWGVEKVVLFFVVLYVAAVCRKLLNASSELAEGREDYRVDTKYLFGAFREHGENLNSLGQGISKAVAERMRSEHLKTELITNVSHDLKTPLTSIINYANLICEEETENPKIAEYSEVLLRQSGRLKKLLEDLVEASKATTGNVEVNLAPCEVGVLLTQAVGEYQQRMEEKGLEIKDRQPEQPVKILADGRHLWRVFDNLLNNICKYAQENTRVYLSLEKQEDKVFIVFRNMSKYPLDISPEELEERFVRGDRSRHMEGNGLGLSIAKSLTELQNGKLNIVIDGDLFKVILTFQALE